MARTVEDTGHRRKEPHRSLSKKVPWSSVLFCSRKCHSAPAPLGKAPGKKSGAWDHTGVPLVTRSGSFGLLDAWMTADVYPCSS